MIILLLYTHAHFTKAMFSMQTKFIFNKFSLAKNLSYKYNSLALSNQTVSVGEPLLDNFGRKHNYLRISVTERCNLRCLYCMPEEGVALTPSSNLLTNEEIYRLAHLFVKGFGVKKIRLTGGEPLIRKDIVDIVSNIATLKNSGLETIGITTNGIVFSRYCKALHNAGLNSVNISLDTLKKERFQLITRRNGLNKVLEAIDAALDVQFDNVKINCVPMVNVNDDEIEDFIELTRNNNLELRFIEYMPFGGNRWNMNKMIPFYQLLNRIRKKYQIAPIKSKSINDTAKLYQVNGFIGTVGFINSMTNPFCAGCNRVRLTADGHLKVCLFDKEEISLKEAIRNGFDDQQIIQMVQNGIKKKKERHDGALNISKDHLNRPMILIGQKRCYSKNSSNDEFSHIDDNGQAKMVDISKKNSTIRIACARSRIYLGTDIMKKIEANQIAKGNVLTVAKMAAIMSSKWTSHLIPLCHLVPLDSVNVEFKFDYKNEEIITECTCKATYKTGVEMEALMAASIGALTIYDMCKALNKAIIIRDCCLVYKSGGKSDYKLNENN